MHCIKLIALHSNSLSGVLELSRVIRVRYEKGVLRPLEPVNLGEGEEVLVFIRKRGVGEVLDKYVGLFGRAAVEELKEYEEEAQDFKLLEEDY